MSPHSSWAEISNTKMFAVSTNVAKPKHLVAMVIKILAFSQIFKMINFWFVITKALEISLYRIMMKCKSF
jgi:hypothetical protein